jgi:hydrogenase-4 component B
VSEPAPVALVLTGAGLQAVSGLAGLIGPGRSRAGQVVSTLLMLASAAAGLLGAFLSVGASEPPELIRAWSLPIGRLALRIDALSAVFLMPAFLVPALGSLYGLSYWRRDGHPDTAPGLGVFYGLLAAALAVVLVAADAVVFLMAWEVMALSAFFLITTDDRDEAVRGAGWIYLVATHLGTLALLAMFALLRRASGGYALDPLQPAAPGFGGATAIFVLAVLGFGLKAGIMPLHVWLPGAHAMAPSHVSAVLSGVMIKAGVYGIVRVCGLLPEPPVAWGAALLLLGAASGVAGVVFALAQHDLKRLLAYHSIENIGIIVMGVGLAMLGRSLGRWDWVVLGMAGAMLHVWNHALFKSLLFLGAGSVIHATGERHMDRLGGLAKAMPRTGALFLVGAVAICGLPPLNGFVSELLVFLGLFHTIGIGRGPSWAGAALAAPALAMIGALAVACFVKVFGAVFLGHPRGEAAERAREAPAAMTLPMAVLAAACFLIGLAPAKVAPLLQRGVAAWSEGSGASLPALEALAPLRVVGWAGAVLLVAVAAVSVALLRRMRREAPTWDCGYAAPSARMQYTASSFAQMLVHVFSWLLRPSVHVQRIDSIFPGPQKFESHVEDVALAGVVLPFFRGSARWLLRLRFLQQGRVQVYILYILVFVVLLLLWTFAIGRGGESVVPP